MKEKLYVVRRGSYIKHLVHPHRRDKIMSVSPSQKMCKRWIDEHKDGERYYIDCIRKESLRYGDKRDLRKIAEFS